MSDTGEYDVAPDIRFLMAKEVSRQARVHITFDWFEELKRAVPGK